MTTGQTISAEKAVARAAALSRRTAAHAAAASGGRDPTGPLRAVLARFRGLPLSGYVAMRSEIDPAPAMAEMAGFGPVAVPVIEGRARPLRFRQWTPGCAMVPGPFGAAIPAAGDWIVPRVLIVPLMAFDRSGGRLGYGGGYFDRTLERLRAAGPVTAVGFAYAAQEAGLLPQEPTDASLDIIVTEAGVILPH